MHLKLKKHFSPSAFYAMENSYQDLIEQTFNFPQEGFHVIENELYFYDIPLMDIIKQYGTPLKITYLPKISSQIQKAKKLQDHITYIIKIIIRTEKKLSKVAYEIARDNINLAKDE